MADEGIHFREFEGRRSSQFVGRRVFADAARNVDASLADSIERESDWRKNYFRYVRVLVELGARSGKNALRIASDGLASLHENLAFIRDGDEVPIDTAYGRYTDARFHTATLGGQRSGSHSLVVPFQDDDLHGDGLRSQLESWERDDVIEPSCAAAVEAVANNPEWLDLSDQTFALLGAASEMGPLEHLTSWGATIVAVDVPRPQVWERIVKAARTGSGTLHAPVAVATDDPDAIVAGAGADLLTHGPEVATWLRSFEGPLTVMDLVYGDGARFVQLVGSIDGLVTSLASTRDDLNLAYLGTPTDVYAVPERTAADALAARKGGPGRATLRALSLGRAYEPRYRDTIEAEEGMSWGISDCIVPQQGPNYILAKNAQRWRAIIAREEGTRVSANVAPATYTQSVVKNRALKAAYGGAHVYGVHVFSPSTSRALMAALLVHDLRNPSSSAAPENPPSHPYELHATAAAHGGIWALPYEPRSVLPLAVLRGLSKFWVR
jgi:hypothetical protein